MLTEGEWAWDEAAGDFNWAACTAVPLALRGVFTEEPRHIDMRWARSDAQLDLHNGRFRAQVAELAAPMHGLAKDDLEGEDVREHRRTLRIAWGAVALLLLLLTASIASALVAVRSADEARASEQAAVDAARGGRPSSGSRAGERGRGTTAQTRSRRQCGRRQPATQPSRREHVAESDRNAANAEAQRRAAGVANEQLAATNDELSSTNSALDEANSNLATTNSQLDQTNQELATSNDALDATNQELASTNGQLTQANDTLTAQAANLDASRLAALAQDQLGTRIDIALLLAAEAQRRAASDTRLPDAALFDILQADGAGLDGLVNVDSGGNGMTPFVAVSPGNERFATVAWNQDSSIHVSVWPSAEPTGPAPRSFTVAAPFAAEPTFGAGGRFLFVRTIVPQGIVDPDAPLPPDILGVTVVDADTGVPVLGYEPVKEGRVEFSDDHEYAAIQTCLPAGADDCVPTVATVDARTGTLLRERPGRLPSALGAGGATVREARTNPDFSADGRHLLVFAAPGEFQIWPLDQPNLTISLYTPSVGTFTIPAFDPTSAVVVGSQHAGEVNLYDVADGSIVDSVPTSGAPIRSVAAGPGGDVIAVLQPGSLTVHGPGTPATASVADCATDLTISPKRQWFVTGGSTCLETDLVEVNGARHVGPLEGHNAGVASADGVNETVAYQHTPLLPGASADSARFGVFDLHAGQWIEVRRGASNVTDSVFDPTSGTVLIGFGYSPTTMVLWSPDGAAHVVPGEGNQRKYFGAGSKVAIADSNGVVAIWDVARVLRPGTIAHLPTHDGGYVGVHAISPRGDVVAVVSPDDDALVQIVDLGTSHVVDEITAPGGLVTGLAFSPDGGTLFIDDYSVRTIRRYDVDRHAFGATLFGDYLTSSPNGRYAAILGFGNTDLRVIDLQDDHQIGQFTVSGGLYDQSDVSVSPDGRYVDVVGAILDIASGQLVTVLPSTPTGFSDASAFDPTGTKLYRVSRDTLATTEVFDTSTWKLLASHSTSLSTFATYVFESPIAVAPDGRFVYAAGELLDAASLSPIGEPGRLLPADGFIGHMTFTKDSTAALLVDGGSVFRFVVDGDVLADQACALAGRNLTADERARFLTTAGAPACPQWPAGS